jgi:REP element-mobilizing transposase RayT
MVKKTRHSLTLVYVHLVWTTKHRVAVLNEQLLGKLCTLAKESGKNQGVEVIVCGGYEDHMHVFVRYRPDQKISDIVPASSRRHCLTGYGERVSFRISTGKMATAPFPFHTTTPIASSTISASRKSTIKKVPPMNSLSLPMRDQMNRSPPGFKPRRIPVVGS